MVLLAATGGHESTDSGQSFGETLRRVFVTGAALTIPLLVTLVVLTFVVNFVLGAISPLVLVIEETFGVGRDLSRLELEALAVLTVLALVFLVGLVAETRSGSGLEETFDAAIARIPGVGSVYTSFSEMSDLLLSNDTQSFREVKLVEFPMEGLYTVAFVTADTPGEFGDATGHEGMTTLFMPLAPNPVMGGFVLHAADERVHDVDLTVEEGLRSIVTSGVATGETDGMPSDGELLDLSAIRRGARDGVADLGDLRSGTADGITDLGTMTVAEVEALGRQTRQELLGTDPDAGEADDDRPVRHYLLTRSEEEPDGDAGVDESESENAGKSENSGGSGDDDGPLADDGSVDNDGTRGERTGERE